MKEIAQGLIRAAAGGFLSPDIPAQMIAAVGQLARITEVSKHLKPEEEAESISEIRITVGVEYPQPLLYFFFGQWDRLLIWALPLAFAALIFVK